MRIICMLLLLAHHMVINGPAANIGGVRYKAVATLFAPLGKICLVAYVFVSCYFMIDSEFSMKKFWKIWREVFFYNLALDFVTLAFTGWQGIDSVKMLLGGCLPILGNSHMFASTYLIYYLLVPFWVKSLTNLDKDNLKRLVIILTVGECGSYIVGKLIDYNQSIKSELLLFAMIFYLAAYIKKYGDNILNGKRRFLAIILIASWGIEYIVFLGHYLNVGTLWDFCWNLIAEEAFILNILAGITLFILFNSFEMKYSRIINQVAKGTFGVLLIHDHPFFRPILWNRVVRIDKIADYGFGVYCLLIVLIPVGIFIVCSFIDALRRLIDK